MTTRNEYLDELKDRRDECIMAGCTSGFVREEDCEKERKDLRTCINNIKNTMQTKTHFLWELGKIILIPILTAAFVFGILQTKVDNLSYTVDKLDKLVIELIQDKR